MAVKQLNTKTLVSDADHHMFVLCGLIATALKVPREQITPETLFAEHLGADSLDLLELVNAIEEQLGVDIDDESLELIKTVRDLATLVEAGSND